MLGQHKKTEVSPRDGQEVDKTKPTTSKRKSNASDKQHIKEQNLYKDNMNSRSEPGHKMKDSPRDKIKARSKRKSSLSDIVTYSFKTLIEDVLLIIFELLNPRDVAAMAQVEKFLSDFVKGKYYPRVILSHKQPQILDNKKFILRLESHNFSFEQIFLLKNQLKNANLKKLKEISIVCGSSPLISNSENERWQRQRQRICMAGYGLVLPNESIGRVRANENISFYDTILSEIFLKSSHLRKVEMFVHASSKGVLSKLPKKVKELCMNFGDFPIADCSNDIDHHHVSSIIQTGLDQANIETLKLHNYKKTANVLKLNSESLLSFEFQNVAKFVLKQLKFPNLTRLSVKDSILAFSTSTLQGEDFFRYLDLSEYARVDIIRVIYEECPKLTLLFGLDISGISRELGYEEWRKGFAGLVKDAADGEIEITKELCNSLTEFNIPGLEQLRLEQLDHDSEDLVEDLIDEMFETGDVSDNSEDDD